MVEMSRMVLSCSQRQYYSVAFFKKNSKTRAASATGCLWNSAMGVCGDIMMGSSFQNMRRVNGIALGAGQGVWKKQSTQDGVWLNVRRGCCCLALMNDTRQNVARRILSGRRMIDSRNVDNDRIGCHRAYSGNGESSTEGDIAGILPHAMLKQTRPLNTARMVKVKHVLVSGGEMVGVVKEQLTAALMAAAGEGTERDGGRVSEIMADIAQQYSTCPSGRNGGDLGWVSVGQMVQEFEDVCFRSRPGEIVECDTEYGHHIVYIEGERKQGEVKPMTVEQLSELLTVGRTEGIESVDAVQLIDVREPSEVEMASLPGFWRVYSLSQFGEWGPNVEYMLDPDMTTVVLCHHGVRSAQVCQFLLRQNFADLRNVTGGISAYSRVVDPSVPEY